MAMLNRVKLTAEFLDREINQRKAAIIQSAEHLAVYLEAKYVRSLTSREKQRIQRELNGVRELVNLLKEN